MSVAINAVCAVACQTGAAIMSSFACDHAVEAKSDSSPLTAADSAVDEAAWAEVTVKIS